MNRLEQIGLMALLRATVPHLKLLGYASEMDRKVICASCGVRTRHEDGCEGAKLLRDVESAVREFG